LILWIDEVLYASKGQKEKAFNAVKETPTEVYTLLGMKDEAIRSCAEWSELQRKLKKSLYYELKTTPFYDNIRSDPRFQEILAKDKELYEENLRKYGDFDI
jgi:hypothetical protein